MRSFFLVISVCLSASGAEPEIVKAVLDVKDAGENLLEPNAWGAWREGFQRDGAVFVCDNGPNKQVQRGASQTVVLNQSRPEPIVAVAWSKAEHVGGSADSDFALYLDLVFTDGTPLWGQTAPFAVGTHDWQRRQVVVLPEKPIRSVTMHLLLRNHSGKASFREPTLQVLRTPAGAFLFDGVQAVARGQTGAGFQVRDVAAGSGFVRLEHEAAEVARSDAETQRKALGAAALGLKLECKQTTQPDATFFDATLTDMTGRDRAVTLIYAVTVPKDGAAWLHDPRESVDVAPQREYTNTTSYRAGNRRLSRYPLGAVSTQAKATALGIDPAYPAFFRIGYNAASQELFLAYDLGLTREKPSARIRFCTFSADAAWGFRGALARYYELFPDAFRCRTPQQGLWMPFAKISKVEGWEDFGFKFKEGHDETGWDDQHGITTFRYTEPMTWWMSMPKDMPRTLEAAVAEAKRRAETKRDAAARALFTSGYHDEEGRFPARLLDTPWCNGAVWSMNSMPGIAGETTDFNVKWNPTIRRQLYGPDRKADLDGEYIDSSEGYVTDELDFRRDHLAAADTPLTFSPDSHKPAIFRGLVAFEYVRGIARDVHADGKLMMANGAPGHLCWLPPLLEVMGTETDWNHNGTWRPMAERELLYRRALCRGKPFCFLMNTDFEKFTPDRVERYMKRSLAYGMFPGFFSHNASEGHYFTRPTIYNRDRPLFKKYVPLCKAVAEAGWEPITQARSSDRRVSVERFGTRYLTVFNDSPERRTATIRLDRPPAGESRELLSGRAITWSDSQATLTLAAEDVAVLDLAPTKP